MPFYFGIGLAGTVVVSLLFGGTIIKVAYKLLKTGHEKNKAIIEKNKKE